jgi:hypothetical protein
MIVNDIDFISKVYPGSQVIIDGKNTKTIIKFKYETVYNNDIPNIYIYDINGVQNCLTLYEGKVLCDGSDARLISYCNDHLVKAWCFLPHCIFPNYMSFLDTRCDIVTLNDFDSQLKLRWIQFAFHAPKISKDQKYSLINKLGNLFNSFDSSNSHSINCSNHMYIFDGEHVCDESVHLKMLLNIVMDSDIVIIQTKNSCLGAVSIMNDTPQYIHITPAGSFIMGDPDYNQKNQDLPRISKIFPVERTLLSLPNYNHKDQDLFDSGNGICRHPLSRLIFWTILLKKRPIYASLFNDKYLQFLNDDLKHHMFIVKSCTTINEIIMNFDTSRCLACSRKHLTTIGDPDGEDNVLSNVYPLIKGWNQNNHIQTKTCIHENKYVDHLTILRIIKKYTPDFHHQEIENTV